MQYKVLLDTYTMILPEFAEQYDNLDNTKKVVMNIEKVIQALNLRDFKYIYNKLDDTTEIKDENVDALSAIAGNKKLYWLDLRNNKIKCVAIYAS